jgi:hypothetical protein
VGLERPKSKAYKQSERITLDGITPGQFDQLVTLLAERICGGEVTLRIIIPREIRLVFNEDKISALLKKKGIPSDCMSQIRTDIPLMLQGILGGRRKAVANFLAENSAPPKAKDERQPSKEQVRAEVETRISCVEQKLVTADLRRQFAIKKSANNNTYVCVYWDIVEKCEDSTGIILSNLTSATVRIVARKPFTMEEEKTFFIPFLLPGLEKPNEEFVLTMTREDLHELIKELSNAEEAIKRTMEKE